MELLEAIVKPYLFGVLRAVSDSTCAYLMPHSLYALAWRLRVVSDRELEHNQANLNFQKEVCGFAVSFSQNEMFGFRRGLSIQHQKDGGRWVDVAKECTSRSKMQEDFKDTSC